MRLSILIIFVSIFAFLNCQKNESIVQPPQNTSPIFSYSHADSIEGADIALWYDYQMVAADSTKSRLMYSLKYLRQTYTDSQSIDPSLEYVLNNRFLAPWVIGQLSVKFDSSTAIQVRNHQYDGWNLLDAAFRPDTFLQGPDDLGWTFFGFTKRYHPIRLAELYKILPGVLIAEPNYYMFAGGTFPMFPGTQSGEMTYVFVINGGDIHGPYYYFRYINSKPMYIGQWSGFSGSPPSWWIDAKRNIDSFYAWKGN